MTIKKKIKVLMYNNTSISAKAIARFNDGKNRIKPNSITFNPKTPTLLINWGVSKILTSNFTTPNIELLNNPTAVGLASNKIKCLNKLTNANIPTLRFTTNLEIAKTFFTGGLKVYCRQKISAHSGAGIIIATNENELVEASLYTQEFPNDIEYRVHVFNGEVINIQQKKKMSSERKAAKGITGTSDDVRALMNGWSFVRTDLTLKDEAGEHLTDLIEVPTSAVNCLGLDFGAVDLAYNKESGDIVVIEVNTAPGQKPATTTNFNYIKAINKYNDTIVTIADYNTRYGCELTEFDNGVTELKNYVND